MILLSLTTRSVPSNGVLDPDELDAGHLFASFQWIFYGIQGFDSIMLSS